MRTPNRYTIIKMSMSMELDAEYLTQLINNICRGHKVVTELTFHRVFSHTRTYLCHNETTVAFLPGLNANWTNINISQRVALPWLTKFPVYPIESVVRLTDESTCELSQHTCCSCCSHLGHLKVTLLFPWPSPVPLAQPSQVDVRPALFPCTTQPQGCQRISASHSPSLDDWGHETWAGNSSVHHSVTLYGDILYRCLVFPGNLQDKRLCWPLTRIATHIYY